MLVWNQNNTLQNIDYEFERWIWVYCNSLENYLWFLQSIFCLLPWILGIVKFRTVTVFSCFNKRYPMTTSHHESTIRLARAKSPFKTTKEFWSGISLNIIELTSKFLIIPLTLEENLWKGEIPYLFPNYHSNFSLHHFNLFKNPITWTLPS